MAFKSEAVREQVKALVLKGEKTKAILAIVGDGCTKGDIGNMRFNLRSAGKIAVIGNKAKSEGGKQGKNASKQKGKKDGDDFETAVRKEISDVEVDIERLKGLAAAYDKTNTGFVIHVEKKIEKETAKLAALKGFLCD